MASSGRTIARNTVVSAPFKLIKGPKNAVAESDWDLWMGLEFVLSDAYCVMVSLFTRDIAFELSCVQLHMFIVALELKVPNWEMARGGQVRHW